MTLKLYCITEDAIHIPVKVTSPTTLLNLDTDSIVCIAKPSGELVRPADSSTGTITEIWDEFNRPVTAEVTWDGAKPSQLGHSVGLLRSET